MDEAKDCNTDEYEGFEEAFQGATNCSKAPWYVPALFFPHLFRKKRRRRREVMETE